jgi:L-rhamnose-H+ transport protein
MNANPVLGVFLHWLGGLASGSFYVPFRGVRHWAWETYWLVGGVFSWIIAPWFFGSIMAGSIAPILSEAQWATLLWCYFWGLLWGLGGLTFGLTMRYLGMSLGMAMVLGYCAAFGTLMPPIFAGEFASKVAGTLSGQVILVGVAVCMCGIAVAGMAGMSKERELPEEQRRAVIKEFSLKKGVAVATFSGVMSACFSYGLAAGDPIKTIALAHGTKTLWQGLPVLVVVLLGGFTTNVIWCLILNVRNRTGHQYLAPTVRNGKLDGPAEKAIRKAVEGPSEGGQIGVAAAEIPEGTPVPLLNNYLFSALAGTTWYFQFFFYTMGETQMGAYKFSSWTLHMASIIIFSTLWGVALHEWRGCSAKTIRLVVLSLALLVASTIVVGYGNYLGTLPAAGD